MSLMMLLALAALLIIGVTATVLFMNKGADNSLKGSAGHQMMPQSGSKNVEAMNRLATASVRGGKKKGGKKDLTIEERMFQAGVFSQAQKADFYRMQKIAPFAVMVLGALFAAYFFESSYILIGAAFGFACGLQLPITILDRKIKARSEEIMYYLPLVIEQLVVGVSSSLDIGPCVQRVSEMADERGSHNCVTELFKLAQHYIRSGTSLPDALVEIGTMSGHNELKHTFMSLAQVVQHGGEVSKRLIEIADSVSQMRETQIEEKIKKLELVATGPVGLVFMGFMLIILVGFGLQLTTGLNQ